MQRRQGQPGDDDDRGHGPIRVAVLAHGRCGTRWAAYLFRRAGWDVQHERCGSDGISSWEWAVQARNTLWGEARGRRPLPPTRLHLVRNPVKAIPSIAFTDSGHTEQWRAQWVWIPAPQEVPDPIERAVWSYYGWNLLIRSQSPTHTYKTRAVEVAVAEITGCDPQRLLSADPESGERNRRSHPAMESHEIVERLSPLGRVAWERTCSMWRKLPG